MNWVKPDSLKSWFQIGFGALAAIGSSAAIFGVYKFYYYDKAAYEPRATLSSSLGWTAVSSSNECEGVFRVDFENIGISSFDVVDCHVRVWAFDEAVLNGDKATYLSRERMTNKGQTLYDSIDPVTKKSFENDEVPFIGHYAPGGKFFRTFQWLVSRNAGKNAYFQADLTLKGEAKPRWFTAVWGPMCVQRQ